MPFKSEAQRAWMYANHPEMAKKWEKHTPKGKKLPKRVNSKESFERAIDKALNETMTKGATKGSIRGASRAPVTGSIAPKDKDKSRQTRTKPITPKRDDKG